MVKYEIVENAAAGYDTTSGFTTAQTEASYINPEVWSRAVLEAERGQIRVAGLGIVNTELLGTGGDILNLTVGKELAASAVAESDKLGVAKIEYVQYTCTPSEAGVSVQATNKELIRAFFDVMTDKTNEMGISLARYKNKAVITALASGASTKKIANAKTYSSDIASSDTIDLTDITTVRTAMRKLRVTPKYLVIGPEVEGDILKLTGFIDASQYGGNSPLLNGEIGKILGMQVIMDDDIASASNKVKSYFLGEGSFVIAVKSMPVFKSDYDVLGRYFTLAAFEDFGIVVHRPDRVGTLESYAA